MKLISSKLTSLVSLEQTQLKPIGRYGGGLHKLALKRTTSTHSLRFVIGLIKQHKVCKLVGDKLHRPPVVALTH